LGFEFEIFAAFLLKLFTFYCQVKYDLVGKRRSYKLFNMTAYRFLASKMFKPKIQCNFQKLITTLLPMTSQ